jgi:DNA-binding NarL/FixJ family response regulator
MVPIRLALIEDHQALRQGLELLLGREGCDVVATAGDSAAGLAMVREHEPDVTVVDIALGSESGIALTRDLLLEDGDRNVVLYTGSSDVEVLLDGLDAIRIVAAGGTYVDPRLRASLFWRRATQRSSLSTREREIIGLLAGGLTGDEVADRLFLSAETVKTHIRNAMSKLEARNRVHAIAIALRDGLIDGVTP